jgi:hypothetical protein
MDKSPGKPGKATKRARDDTSGAGGHAVGSGMGRNLSADEKVIRTAESARQLEAVLVEQARMKEARIRYLSASVRI